MCGITGFFGTARDAFQDADASVRAMTNRLRTRGPDAQDVWTDFDARIALGHCRLAIVDVSAAGAQPMASHCGRFIATYNGELYNTQSLKRRVEDLRDVNWRGHSDTEVFLELIAARGLRSALELADGMFAIAVFDRHTRKLMLARDSFGEKPLYYGLVKGRFAFASQPSALRSLPGFDPKLDPTAVAYYFQRSYIPAPLSIYHCLKKLPPAHYMCLDPSDLEAGRLPDPVAYWDAKEAALQARSQLYGGSFAECTADLGSILANTVQSRSVSDVPLGCLLSGGIDSSTIAAMMATQGPTPRSFCIGMDEEGFNEAVHARDVAKHLGCDHTELMVTPSDLLETVPDLPTVYDEPFADSSQVPSLLVSALARNDVTVALTGDGGDEMFGGYNRHIFGPRLWHRSRFIPPVLRSLASFALRRIPTGPLARHLMPGLAQGRAKENLHKLANVLPARSAAELYERLTMTGPMSGNLARYNPTGVAPGADFFDLSLGFTEAAQLADTCGYLPGDILAKLDRAAMHHSLETRAPFLSRDIFTFAWSLPTAFKVQGNQGKRILRALLYAHVPQALVDRPKAGFAVPIGRWLRGPLRDWGGDLLPHRTDEMLDAKLCHKLWAQHQSGRANHETALWSVLMFQSWRQAHHRLGDGF